MVLVIVVIITTVAYIPTLMIDPVSRMAQTICYFIFLTLWIALAVFFIYILSKFAK